MKQFVANHIKNVQGWKTSRKLVAFAVDDYGNIRLHSSKAKENLIKKGVELKNRFDHFDGLDTKADYDSLFDTLSSVKDANGKAAVFTPYALSCNFNFTESLAQEEYVPERLDVTYKRFSAEYPKYFEGAFELLKEGIKTGVIRPQFHGREHINLNLINRHLKDKNPLLLANLEEFSLAGIPKHPDLKNVSFNEAFSLAYENEVVDHKDIIANGIEVFENVYGYKPETFTPPGQKLHPNLFEFVAGLGFVGIDKVRSSRVHLGSNKFVSEKNILGTPITSQATTIVRNCVFEPTDSRGFDWVEYTFNQIRAAFFWKKPAIVSSHRVNYSGLIDENNRKIGINDLKKLLKKIVQAYPDVEFVSVDQIAKMICYDK